MLTRDAMIKALKEKGPMCPVLEATDSEIPTVSARATLESAIKVLQESRAPAVGATDSSDRLVGLLTAENLGEMMMIRAPDPRITKAPGGGGWVNPRRLPRSRPPLYTGRESAGRLGPRSISGPST